MNKYTICGSGAIALHSGLDETLAGWGAVLFTCWLFLVMFTDGEED